VSNGREAFPNLIMVLQGDGVTIRLVGDKTVAEPLIAPTVFVGQNGATFNQQTVVSVTGCPKAVKAKAKAKHKGKRKKK
jgi:hypothetical protein